MTLIDKIFQLLLLINNVRVRETLSHGLEKELTNTEISKEVMN